MKRKSFLVIGLGRFGSSVARTLASLNADILAIDISAEEVRDISTDVQNCLVADSTNINVLEEIGTKNIDHAVVAIGNNLQASILTVLNLKNLGVKSITVRADEIGHKEVYTLLGATEVIIPEESAAVNLANQMMSDSVLDYYPLSNDYAMVKCSVGDKFEPKTLIELNVRNTYDVNIVGLYKKGVFAIPKGTDLLEPGTVAVVVGTKIKLKKFDQFLNCKKRKILNVEG